MTVACYRALRTGVNGRAPPRRGHGTDQKYHYHKIAMERYSVDEPRVNAWLELPL